MKVMDVVGKTVEEAKDLLEKNEYSMRVVKENNVYLVTSLEYRKNRVGVGVVNGIVTSYEGMG